MACVCLQESFEWVDFRELTDEEIKPHSLHPLPLPKPAAPVPMLTSPLTVAPVIIPPVPGTTPAQVCPFPDFKIFISEFSPALVKCFEVEDILSTNRADTS